MTPTEETLTTCILVSVQSTMILLVVVTCNHDSFTVGCQNIVIFSCEGCLASQ